MAECIAACGVIIFEFQIDVAPKSERFPRLNRLTSGLSLGALVVKAAKRSGSLITAYFAAEQSLEVFTIFHSIHNSTAKGCHALIRQGAKLVEFIDDLLKETAG